MSDDNSALIGPSKRYHFFGRYIVEVVHSAEAANQDEAERQVLQQLFADYGMGELDVYSIDEEDL